MSEMALPEKDYGEPMKFDPMFKGPLQKRSCTDVICLILFIGFLGGWGAVSWYAISHGDLDRLLLPTDSRGMKCGADSNRIDRPYLVFFDLTKCADPTVTISGCDTPQVCVKECPKESFFFDLECVGGNFDAVKKKLICIDGVNLDAITSCEIAQKYIDDKKCAQWYLKSDSFSHRCIPSDFNSTIVLWEQAGKHFEKLGESIGIAKDLALINGMGQMIVEDMMDSWWHILIGLVISMFACLIFIGIMRWLAGPTIWFSIVAVLGILGYSIYFCFTRYKELKNNPVLAEPGYNVNSYFKALTSSANAWLYTMIGLSVILLIILLVVIFLRKRIIIAIALVKEGSKAVSSITSTVFFPLFPWMLQLLVIGFAVVTALYLASVGVPKFEVILMKNDQCICTGEIAINYKNGSTCDPYVFDQNCHKPGGKLACEQATCHFKEISSPKLVSYFHGVNVIGFLWGVFFISAFGEMVLAATFATWYWTFHKSDVPFFTLAVGSGRTIRYHLGTIAFGSLIITICRLIRMILEYIDQKVKAYDNQLTKALLCCLKCFFWCLENFLKFLNKNAYIMCAIHGKHFCGSAKDAFNLLMRNFLRVIALDKVTDFLFFISKILISVGMGLLTYVFFTSTANDYKLHYNFVPVFLVTLGTYLIATIFFNVYSMAVDTLFLCFLEDCERNDGSKEKPYFMSKQLMKILGKKNDVKKKNYARH